MSDLIYKILLIGNDMMGLNSELEQRDQLVYTYHDGIKLLNAIDDDSLNPVDVIILSLSIKGISGWDLLRKIKSTTSIKEIPLILISEFDDETTEIQSLCLGSDDYINKNASVKLILARIEANLRNRISTSSIEDKYIENKNSITKLTQREKEVLSLIVRGYTNKEIADKIFITSLTAANHVKNILKKLSLKNRTQAVLFAIKNNLTQVIL